MSTRDILFLFLFGSKHYNHALAFEQGHRFYFAVFFEVVCEAKQQYFALFLEQNGTAFKEYVCLYFGTFLQKAYGVLKLEVVVVVVGLGAETNFFYNNLRCLGLDFFLFLFLLIQILLIIKDFAYGGIGLGRDFNEVEFELVGYGTGLLNGVDAWSYIVSDKTHLAGTDVLVYVVGVFGVMVGKTTVALRASGAGTLWTGSGGKVGFFLHSGGY